MLRAPANLILLDQLGGYRGWQPTRRIVRARDELRSEAQILLHPRPEGARGVVLHRIGTVRAVLLLSDCPLQQAREDQRLRVRVRIRASGPGLRSGLGLGLGIGLGLGLGLHRVRLRVRLGL